LKRSEVASLMSEVFVKCSKFREAGQKEYAHEEDNAFRNFEQTGRDINLDRKRVLYIFMKKHLDGIVAAINGHVSQREPVEGRICDAIVYLILLAGMFREDGSNPSAQLNQTSIQNQIQIPRSGHQFHNDNMGA